MMELILTVMASDRPGIVEQLASVIEAEGASWQESRMATMAGRFTGIIRVELDQNRYPALQKALQGLRDKGLSVQIELGETEAEIAQRCTVAVVGNDRPGIVREVSRALAAININVIDLTTEVEPASMSGGVLFRAEIEVGLTAAQSLDSVIAGLEGLSPDLMVDRTG
ncbi:MAG: glycine cleavage system transcriptional repressor [Saccharospirillum sp.]